MSEPNLKISNQLLKARQLKEEYEFRKLADILKQDIEDRKQQLVEAISESNEWCQILGIQRGYRLEEQTAGYNKGSLDFGVWIEDRIPKANDTRRVSAELFEREHQKLETLMEARQWSKIPKRTVQMSSAITNKATLYGTQLRRPISGAGTHRARPPKEQPKQVIQDELVAAIEETNKLTAALEQQLLQFENSGWSS